MDNTVLTTKEALLEAAGELFADAGLDGVSIRAIAKKARANIAAIHYHFGSKESLYLEVVRHVMTRMRCKLAGEYLRSRDSWQGDPEKSSEVVCKLVEERLRQFFPGLHPRWYGRLFMRILLSPSPALWKLAEEIILPDFEELKTVFRCCKPGMSSMESELWSDTLVGQLSHYVFSEQFVQFMPNHSRYDEVFQKNVLHHLSRLLLKGLDLPVPVFLKEGTRHD